MYSQGGNDLCWMSREGKEGWCQAYYHDKDFEGFTLNEMGSIWSL